MYGYIYKTTFPDGKIYIGQKQSAHFVDSYFGSGIYVKRYIKIYGSSTLKVELIKECNTREELNEMEIFYIGKFNSLMPNGYNIALGGSAGNTFVGKTNEEMLDIKEKLSKSHKGISNPKNSKPCPEERKIKISNSLHKYFNSMTEEQRKNICGKGNRGRIQSEKEKQKRNNSNRGKKHHTAGEKISRALKGRKFSKEWKEKISLSRVGKSPENKGKICINKNGVIKYITHEELSNFLNDGWNLGRT